MQRMFALVAFLLVAPPAWPQIPALCGDAPSQSEANRCASDKFAKADAELNRLYRALLAATDEKGRRFVQEAHQAWIAFRDKECVARTGGGPNQGGTIWPMMYLECKTLVTEQHAKDLQEQVNCPGGKWDC